MARRKLSVIVRYLQHLAAPDGPGLDDAELLERYVHHRDEAAFELLLWRHGVLVFNVCRRLLPNPQDAEDAFQATFLAFVRKAHTISRRGSVASWLYKVAYRAALEARTRARKRAERERPGGESRAIQPPASPWDDVRPILDEELNRLPERLRLPLVLCYLEGKTNEEAARLLGCRPGTIFSRLARGRELLRRRLLRRGVSLSGVVLTALLAERAAEAVPAAPLIAAVVRAALLYAGGQAAGKVSIQVTVLAEGVLRTMFVTKLKMAALMMLAVGLLIAGGALAHHALNAAAPPVAEQAGEKKAAEVRPAAEGKVRRVDGAGRVRPAAQQQVYPAVSGFLKRQLVDIGDQVKKGQLLAELDAPLLAKDAEQAEAAYQLARGQYLEAKANVATAEADLKTADGRIRECERKLASDKKYLDFRKKQIDRYQGLLRSGSIEQRLLDEQEDRHAAAVEAVAASQEALGSARAVIAVKQSKIESAKAALESAEANVKMAQVALDKARLKVAFTQLRASFDGIVTQRNFDTGEFIPAADQGTRRPLLTVMRTDVVRVVVDVVEKEAPNIRPGLPVKLYPGILPHFSTSNVPEERTLTGKVSRIGYSLDDRFATMPVEIDMPNPNGQLRPGMRLSVAIFVNKPEP